MFEDGQDTAFQLVALCQDTVLIAAVGFQHSIIVWQLGAIRMISGILLDDITYGFKIGDLFFPFFIKFLLN